MTTSTPRPALRLTRLTRRFGDVAAVDDIDLEVPTGAFLVLLGPSGCGKTTTLRMLAGLEAPTTGEIHLGDRLVASGDTGESVTPGKRGAGLVFQSYALWPHMSVRANVEWPLRIAKWSRARRAARCLEVMSMLGIEGLADRYPGEISGGQQQRVAIARTIAPEPAVLLFDEPLSNLDAKLRVETRGELLRIHRATGATSVYVTHDQVEAMTMATHVALMRDGRIEQFGPPHELLNHPATTFVATFIGTPPANVLEARITGGQYVIGAVPVGRTGDTNGTKRRLMYRAENLEIGGTGPGYLDVQETSPLAGRWVLAGVMEGQRVSVTTDRLPGDAVGQRLPLRFPERPDVVFDESGDRLDAVTLPA